MEDSLCKVCPQVKIGIPRTCSGERLGEEGGATLVNEIYVASPYRPRIVTPPFHHKPLLTQSFRSS